MATLAEKRRRKCLRQLAWQRDNYAKVLEWRAKNRERLAAYARARRLEKRDQLNAQARARWAADPAKFRAQAKANRHNRRAIIREDGGRITKADIEARFAEQGGVCFYCLAKLSDYDVDHVTPLSGGGRNVPENIVCACKRCNNSKRAGDPAVFMAFRVIYTDTPPTPPWGPDEPTFE